MALVAATVANDGELMRPRLVTAMTGQRSGTRTIGPRSMGRVIPVPNAEAIKAAMVQAVEGPLGRQFTTGAKVERRHHGRQVRHGRAGRHRRAALLVHRVRAGRRTRRSRSRCWWNRPGVAARWRRRSPAGLMAQLPERASSDRADRATSRPPSRDRSRRCAARAARPADDRADRPGRDRARAGGAVRRVAVASWAGGEVFLAAMGAIGCLMTIWVGAMTLIRG